jgi:putative glutamine amidotransferase
MLIKKLPVTMKKVLISCSTHDAMLYIKALQKFHIEAVLSGAPEESSDYDGLLLPGGGDISPVFYHRKNRGSNHISISEDIIQLLMFHRFMEQKKPILGICKGMQVINVALGGTLIQALPTVNSHAWHNGDRYHPTTIIPGSILSSLYGTYMITGSAHHQAISTPGKGLKAVQHAHDGVIEGIEHNILPILGVQWHPERLCNLADTSATDATDNKPLPANAGNGLCIFEWFSSVL